MRQRGFQRTPWLLKGRDEDEETPPVFEPGGVLVNNDGTILTNNDGTQLTND